MTMERDERLKALVKIVEGENYRTQSELVDALRAEGFSVTQSSVSRDIRELGLRKVGGVYALSLSETSESEVDVWAFVEEVIAAGDHLIVIRCHTAMAQPIAAIIDEADVEGFAGTIAGDDTVFVAMRDAESAASLRRRLRVRAGLISS